MNSRSSAKAHPCLGGKVSTDPSWWALDARGIPLTRICDRCRREKLSRFRPEILTGYNRSDVDEPIDPDEMTGALSW